MQNETVGGNARKMQVSPPTVGKFGKVCKESASETAETGSQTALAYGRVTRQDRSTGRSVVVTDRLKAERASPIPLADAMTTRPRPVATMTLVSETGRGRAKGRCKVLAVVAIPNLREAVASCRPMATAASTPTAHGRLMGGLAAPVMEAVPAGQAVTTTTIATTAETRA